MNWEVPQFLSPINFSPTHSQRVTFPTTRTWVQRVGRCSSSSAPSWQCTWCAPISLKLHRRWSKRLPNMIERRGKVQLPANMAQGRRAPSSNRIPTGVPLHYYLLFHNNLSLSHLLQFAKAITLPISYLPQDLVLRWVSTIICWERFTLPSLKSKTSTCTKVPCYWARSSITSLHLRRNLLVLWAYKGHIKGAINVCQHLQHLQLRTQTEIN